jgi:hypothetical protein
MRILIVDTFYGPYLQRLYTGGALAQQPWAKQHKAHFVGGFGTGDAYSHGLGLLGVEAIEIVANSPVLQQAWAREHEPGLLQLAPEIQQLLAILEAQIRWWKPTVLYAQDINWLPAAFLQHVKPLVEIVVGQNACPLAPGLDLSSYNLLLTSLPHYVGRFRSQGVPAAYFPIGFDHRLLQRHRTDAPRPHALTFVGSLGGHHSQGTQMLEAVARELPLQVWGYGGQQLPADSILRQRWRGEAWADEMYGLLGSSQITFNRHIDIAEGYANNMRLYEATGMGACLITDAKSNLGSLFKPDIEVVTYNSQEEAVDKIRDLLNRPHEAMEIAARGQQKTLSCHTYDMRMRLLRDILLSHFSSQKAPRAHNTIKKQSILVVFHSDDLNCLPKSFSRFMMARHRNHSVVILTDRDITDSNIKASAESSFWIVKSTDKVVQACEACVDACQPDTVLILDPAYSAERIYCSLITKTIHRVAETRKIPFFFISAQTALAYHEHLQIRTFKEVEF